MPRSKPTPEDGLGAALVLAQRWLARREHSEREVRDKLERKSVAAADVDAAIEALRAEGWLSNERFALSMARHRCAQGRGPRWVRHELEQHGIAAALVEQALDQRELDWIAAARQAAGRVAGDSPKLWRKLQARGFGADQIRAALAAAGQDSRS